MLTITHTHATGTLIDGTNRGDGAADILKASGWRWGRSIGSWYVPRSRDTAANVGLITSTSAALERSGFAVTVDIDDTRRSTAAVEADRSQRAEDRAARLEVRAERKSSAEEAAWAREQELAAKLPPMGEPIKIGHHSETRHRRDIERSWNALGAAVDATAEARNARASADVARASSAARLTPAAVATRLERIATDIRDRERKIAGYSHKFSADYTETYPPASGDRAERLRLELAGLQDDQAYWTTVREQQLADGTAHDYSPATIGKGDSVAIGRSWYLVHRVNPKTVSLVTGERHGRIQTGTVPYAKLTGHRTAG